MKHGNVRFKVARLLVGLALVLCVLVSSPVLAEVYKWTDENGVTHFSQTPPPNEQEVEIQDIQEFEADDGANLPANENLAGGDEDAAELSAAELKRQELATAREASAQEKAERAAFCRDARQQLAQLEPSRRVFYTDENGQTVRMDDEQRVSAVQQLRDLISTECR